LTERGALLLAGGAHLALLAALSLTWAAQHSDAPSFEEMSPVEVLDISDVPSVTEIPQPSIEAAPQETVEASAPELSPEETVAEPEPAPVPQPAATPEPEPRLSDVPPPEARPEPEPRPVETKKAEVKPAAPAKPRSETKPQATKVAPKRLDAQELANLIDKDLPKARRKPLDTSALADSLEKAIPRGAKLDARATATLAQAIRAQVAPCWNPPIGGADVREMTVVLRIDLRKDGTVDGAPDLVSQTGVSSGNQAYAKAFADSARRAVLRCSPLKLPADLYDAWKTVELSMNPSEMT
jgi:outer membrane biosynthesis protein TonB